MQKLAAETLKEAYTGFSGVRTAAGGQDTTRTYKKFVEEFNKGQVTIAATAFLRYGCRAIP